MKVKKMILAMVVLVCGIAMVNAQPPRGGHHGRGHMDPEKMVEQRVERMDKELGLNAEQKKAITAILKDEQARMTPPQRTEGERPTKEEMDARMAQMKEQRAATDAKIKAVLTVEQQAKYAELQAKHDKDGKKPGKKGGKKREGKDDGGCKGGCCGDKK